MYRCLQTAAIVFALNLATRASLLAADPLPLTAEQTEFFEKKVRPVLADHCYKCHSAGAERIKGGLLLDSREGWVKGGDSGTALIPGKAEESLLIKAVRYTDPDLQMPPKEKLSEQQIKDLEAWVNLGAPDPRRETTAALAVTKPGGLSVEEGRKFWAFVSPKKIAPPKVKNQKWPRNEMDRFTLGALESKGLKPVPDADRAALVRRVYFDLIGLPPTPEQIDAFVRNTRSDAWAKLVDELLATPQFGERWGRHWLDVARFAESSGGGRTLLFKDAWRYRDYVIHAFNTDLPFNQFVQEQIAGDLLPASSVAERQRKLVATAFLALGPTNYEEQDKAALRMDVVDEQLDTLGKAFMGMTIGCARCHDHKFDPIPTRDYYALAGILRSTRTLHNYTDNVARWVDTPLPLEAKEESALSKHEAKVKDLEGRIKSAKATMAKAQAGVAQATTTPGVPIAVENLSGIVVDDTKAKRIGNWKHSQYSKSYVGEGYVHDENSGKGEKTLTFVPEIRRAGSYEVRLAYVASQNRDARVPVTVFHANGEQTIYVNEQESPLIEGRFISLGKFSFEQKGEGYVLISNEGTTGHVVVDAVQFLPVDEAPVAVAARKDSQRDEAAELLKQLEAELKQLNATATPRPLAMSVKDAEEIGDYHVCIRGNIRNPGEGVPRGVLSVATAGGAPLMPQNESGRRQLAEWLASDANPLTARVFVNRVWYWLFGEGLVATVDNFGTTGEVPSHPELLDHLAVSFMEQGWSVKTLIRHIVLSRAYQLSTEGDAAALGADPTNRLLWRMNRRRLDAEAIRDAILAVSGQLRLEVGGPNINGAKTIDANDAGAGNIEYGYKFVDMRRSVYVPAFRNLRLELFEVFDFADINQVMGRRNISTVAPQALYLMNHPFVMEQARHAAKKTLANSQVTNAQRIEQVYRSALGRPPTDTERSLANEFLSDKATDLTEQWAQFYQVIFSSLDFRYLN
jgi:hypothetical protein